MLFTTRLKPSLDWVHKSWHVSHSYTGGSTNGIWVIHYLHRFVYVSVPLWNAFSSLPSGNIRRVIDTTAPGGGTSAIAPSASDADDLNNLYCLSVKIQFLQSS